MARHEISETRNPLQVIVRCTCGWRFQTTRRQNALARASKIRGAVNAHFKAVDAQEAERR